MARYLVKIHTPQELNHSSFVHTGLYALKQKGLIEVKVVLKYASKLGKRTINDNGENYTTLHAFPKASYYTLLDNKTKKKYFFVTDLYDHAECFSDFGLKKATFYFKRNYQKKYINFLDKELQDKIVPLGLTFGVHLYRKQNGIKHLSGILFSNLSFKFDRLFFKRIFKILGRQFRHWNFVKNSRLLLRFENDNSPKKNTIFFQTRCFRNNSDNDVTAIHQDRYRIIKLLKSHFPNNFNGGFIENDFLSSKYYDAITDVPSEPEKYLNALKKAKIVIYTRGLAQSPAWKMAEYMSQAKVIIAEKLTTDLPVPLTHGKEVLFFDNDEELIANIELVLNNESLANKLSENARIYFEKYVHPEKSVKRVLEIVLNKKL